MESVSKTVLSAQNLWIARKDIDISKELIPITLLEEDRIKPTRPDLLLYPQVSAFPKSLPISFLLSIDTEAHN